MIEHMARHRTSSEPYGTHTYTGPSTIFGLKRGERCVIDGKRAGGLRIRTAGGRHFVVGRQQVRAG